MDTADVMEDSDGKNANWTCWLAEIDGVGDELFAEGRCAVIKDTFETGPQSSSHEALLFATCATVQLVLLEAPNWTLLGKDDDFTSGIP